MSQLKRYSSGVKEKKGNSSASEVGADLQDELGNAAILEQLNGPSGRVFTKIVEASGDEATVDSTFKESDLKEYLENQLDFANGEFFRGAKVSGAAEAMFKELDTTGDGVVDWSEFSAINSQLTELLIPLVGEEEMSAEKITEIANAQFDTLSGSEDGFLDLDELQADALDRLPEGTDHKGLVAQLAARLALDAIDRDQNDQEVGDRQISRQEWVQTAVEILQKKR